MRYLSLLLLLLLIAPGSALAVREYSGPLPSGASFHIQAPDAWQAGGRLVVYNHGFSMSPVADNSNPRLAPSDFFKNYLNAAGYAIAASSYRQRGWALFDAPDDNRELLAEARTRIGAPGEVILLGGSLGGLVSMKTAEAYSEDQVPLRGVYALCPPLAGARTWDGAFDLRLAYDAVCASVGGGEIPEGAAPLPWALDLERIPPDLGDFTDLADLEEPATFFARINQCTGVSYPPTLRSSGQRERLGRLMDLMGLSDEDFFVTNMGYSVFALGDLVRAPDKMDGRNPFGNRFVDYGDALINASIRRVDADPLAALDFQLASSLNGRVGSAKILATHTSRDELVVTEHLSVLPGLIPAAQLASAVVREASPEHCGYSEAEFLAGFELLREWIDGAVKPDATRLQNRCEQLDNAGLGLGGPCRYDPSYVVADFDARVRPRNLPVAPNVDGRMSGQWFDPSRPGEGLFVEILAGNRALVYFFTYPAEGAAGQQTWLVGVGDIIGNAIVIDDLRKTRGARFGTAFRPEDVVSTHWGTLNISFDQCAQARLRWQGPPEYGSRDGTLRQLSQIAGYRCNGPQIASHDIWSGAWFDTRRAGEGFLFELLENDRLLVAYFTYDNEREQQWLVGEGTISSIDFNGYSTGVAAVPLYRATGTRFGAAFDPGDIQTTLAGNLLIEFFSRPGETPSVITSYVPQGLALPLPASLTRLSLPLGVSLP